MPSRLEVLGILTSRAITNNNLQYNTQSNSPYRSSRDALRGFFSRFASRLFSRLSRIARDFIAQVLYRHLFFVEIPQLAFPLLGADFPPKLNWHVLAVKRALPGAGGSASHVPRLPVKCVVNISTGPRPARSSLLRNCFLAPHLRRVRVRRFPPSRVVRDAVPSLAALDTGREHDGDVHQDLQNSSQHDDEPHSPRGLGYVLSVFVGHGVKAFYTFISAIRS